MYQVFVVEHEQQLQKAYDVRKKVFVEEQGVPEHLELDEYDQSAVHFVVMDNDNAICTARLREIESSVGKVERVAVLKEYRGKRLGFFIMQEIEEYAIKHGFKKLKLNAQSYAIPFYEKLNYHVTSPEFLDAHIPHRAMEKTIL